jgi:hypothetical protein
MNTFPVWLHADEKSADFDWRSDTPGSIMERTFHLNKGVPYRG